MTITQECKAEPKLKIKVTDKLRIWQLGKILGDVVGLKRGWGPLFVWVSMTLVCVCVCVILAGLFWFGNVEVSELRIKVV